MEILVFQTNVEESQLATIGALLSTVDGIEKWTMDLNDCDKVLRIVAQNLAGIEIESLLSEAGFSCRPLTW